MEDLLKYQEQLHELMKLAWKAGAFDIKKLSAYCRSKTNPPRESDFVQMKRLIEGLEN